MTDDDIKALRAAIADPALQDTDASPFDTWRAVLALFKECHHERITRLLDEVERLRAELAEATRDAERYRWLRGDSCQEYSDRWTQWEIRCWRAPFWTTDLRHEHLDDAVDTAMRKEGGE